MYRWINRYKLKKDAGMLYLLEYEINILIECEREKEKGKHLKEV